MYCFSKIASSICTPNMDEYLPLCHASFTNFALFIYYCLQSIKCWLKCEIQLGKRIWCKPLTTHTLLNYNLI